MLYNELIELTKLDKSPFFFVDQTHSDGFTYRIFNYRLASWEEFKLPSALECRGIIFRMEEHPVLVSRPFQKFFNQTEGDIDHDLTKVIRLENKWDGSLIRTFLDKSNRVCLASKGSLHSEQAIAAQKIYDSYPERTKALYDLFVKTGYTILFEYISPTNQIVVRYQKPELKLLAIRHNDSGEYVNVKPEGSITENIPEVINQTKDSTQENFEGYVAVYADGFRFKIKTNRYCRLHQLKDDINSVSKLIDMSLYEELDDAIAAFSDYPEIKSDLILIDGIVKYKFRKWEESCLMVMNSLRLKCSDRKTFAITAKAEYSDIFHFLMAMYSEKDFDMYKLFKELFLVDIENEYQFSKVD